MKPQKPHEKQNNNTYGTMYVYYETANEVVLKYY